MSPGLISIDHWHVLLGGFSQREGEPTGIVELWGQLHALYSDASTRVEWRKWSDKLDGLAELIFATRPNLSPPTVKIYGYSWGGAAAVKLAKALRRRGIPVAHLVLCDAVYRHWYWLGAWRAFWPFSQLEVPDNVRRVVWLRQFENLPMGHDVVAADPEKTFVEPPRVVHGVEHVYMDECDQFMQAALAVAESAF